MSTPTTSGIALRELRARLSLSRPELARFLGVSEVSIVRWENGNGPRNMSATLVRAIAMSVDDAGVATTREAILLAAVDPLRSVHMVISWALGRNV